MTNSSSKIVRNSDKLIDRINLLQRPVVFTNGCFDILHRGHVTYLQEAAQLGQSLVVGVNTDTSVQSLGKAADRPFNTLEDRMEVLAALQCVDLVVPFGEQTPLKLIEQVNPDHLVKGGDWKPEDIVGNEIVTQNGGQVHSIPFRFQRSTTALVERIRGK